MDFMLLHINPDNINHIMIDDQNFHLVLIAFTGSSFAACRAG